MKGCFSFGVLPSKNSGWWRNNADELLATLYFGERICQNFGRFVFKFGCRKWKRRVLGRNFPFAPLISLGEIRAVLSYTSLFFKFFNYLNNCFEIQIFNFFFIFYQMIPRMCFVISVIFKNFRQITQSFNCLVFATKITFLAL